jgi:hypothetical protein
LIFSVSLFTPPRVLVDGVVDELDEHGDGDKEERGLQLTPLGGSEPEEVRVRIGIGIVPGRRFAGDDERDKVPGWNMGTN